MEIQSNVYLEKARQADVMLAGGQKPDPPTQDDVKGLFELWATMIPKALKPGSGITYETIVKSENIAWAHYVFSIICERTGIGGKLGEDLFVFFRDGHGQDSGVGVRPDGPLPERAGGEGHIGHGPSRLERFLRRKREKAVDV